MMNNKELVLFINGGSLTSLCRKNLSRTNTRREEDIEDQENPLKNPMAPNFV